MKPDGFMGLSFWVCSSFALFFAFSLVKLKNARKRKQIKHHPSKGVENSKIVIALEIKDLLIKYSTKSSVGFLPLELPTKPSKWEELKRKFFNVGNFYRPIFSIQKTKEFIFGLKSLSKVGLILYTSLDPEVADVILKKLGVEKCFP